MSIAVHATAADALQVGDPVVVRQRLDDRWAAGFDVAEIRHGRLGVGIVLRRRSDGRVLPAVFETRDVRAA